MADLVIAKGNIFQDGQIHSVWLQGEETQLINRNTSLLNQNIQLQIDALTLDLELDNTSQKSLSGALSSGEQQLTLSNLNYQDRRLTFSADMTPAGFDGINRFTLWFDQQGVHGRMLDKQGAVTLLAGITTDNLPSTVQTTAEQAPNYILSLIHI